ncbi:hypothetical protein [Promicromonospora panici]|uniref:hypothetical protein n=1 Tax=Promicromonospora panici TaxID=2219658 RepID=UPI00101DFD57|nr:hypothetical protein [Promicromonospora panici]
MGQRRGARRLRAARLRARGATSVAGDRSHDPGWYAGAEPEAAAQGITTIQERSGVAALVLASDGVDPERHPEATTWRGLYDEARRIGAARVLLDIHDAEATDPDGRRWPRSKRHDDKTLVAVTLMR